MGYILSATLGHGYIPSAELLASDPASTGAAIALAWRPTAVTHHSLLNLSACLPLIGA
jgi:hypothetical protein